MISSQRSRRLQSQRQPRENQEWVAPIFSRGLRNISDKHVCVCNTSQRMSDNGCTNMLKFKLCLCNHSNHNISYTVEMFPPTWMCCQAVSSCMPMPSLNGPVIFLTRFLPCPGIV
uniref:Uncharacterized protein n=1 Tax=Cacopsylla melanoneura TaxID=428564 RepID=A0A8D8XPS6_9HEMI